MFASVGFFPWRLLIDGPLDRDLILEIGERSKFFEHNKVKNKAPPPVMLIMLYDFLFGKGISGASLLASRRSICAGL